MLNRTRLSRLLLLTSALSFPTLAHAQNEAPDAAEDPVAAQVEEADTLDDEAQSDDPAQPEVSIPGGSIIVTGRRNRDPSRSSGQVLSVLSSEDIARTGEGDIAGALSRVTGLSLVGDGRVFVRGLGDRYSLALLNGLPLPLSLIHI